MEKYNMMALSTGHVSRHTAILMDNDNIRGVVVPDEGIDLDKLEDSECPTCLYRCMEYARENGCG